MKTVDQKLPVPAPWQAAVRRCQEDLRGRLDLPSSAVAATRVDETEWRDEQDQKGGWEKGLEVWLLAAGQAHRYRARLDGSAAWPLGR